MPVIFTSYICASSTRLCIYFDASNPGLSSLRHCAFDVVVVVVNVVSSGGGAGGAGAAAVEKVFHKISAKVDLKIYFPLFIFSSMW